MTAASPPATPAPDPGDATARKPGLLMRLLPMLTLVIGAVAGGAGAAIGLVASGLAGGGGAAAPAAAHAPSAPVQYAEIDNAFTSNLVDTGRYLQLRLSVSTTGGEDAVAEIEKHKPALVSAVLAVLGDLSEADVADRVAKDKLRGRLRVAINEVLKAKTEHASIEDVLLTSLVVQ